MKARNSVLKAIKTIYQKAEDSERSNAVFKALIPEIKVLTSFLRITQNQSFFFAIIFSKCLSETSIERTDIARFLNLDILELMEYEPDIKCLFEKGFLYEVRHRIRRNNGYVNESFTINSQIQKAILTNTKVPSFSDVKIKDSVHLVDYVYDIIKQVIDEDLQFSDVLKNLHVVFKNNRQIGLLGVLYQKGLSVEDICILLYYIGLFRVGEKDKCIRSLSVDLYGENGVSSNIIQNMVYGKHILVKESFLRNSSSHRSDEYDFQITGETKSLIRDFGVLPEFEIKVCKNTFELLHAVQSFYQQKENEFITAREVVLQTENLMFANENMQIVKDLKTLKLKNSLHETIYLKSLYDGGIGEETDLEDLSQAVFESDHEGAIFKAGLANEENELIHRGLLELTEASFFSNARIRLTDISQQLLADCGMEVLEKKKNSYSILPGDIKAKQLFYNDEDATTMEMLRQVLKEDKFSSIQKRMSEKALPTGVVALLYGVPGTGKTESVYQMAKQTGREVIQVDISKSKSMWFGESEKQIKKIFTQYEHYSKRCKLKPILLFNEADAIISQRRSMTSTSISQTENRMQNILLEELEKFSGICIATTNLINNIDTAFERRFLYKIQLHKPDNETRMKIWRSKLSDTKCMDMADHLKQYSFSGGQIDNIIKKIEMHEILQGAEPSLTELISWCDSEFFERNNIRPIGFNMKN